jgi:hypothetical protein
VENLASVEPGFPPQHMGAQLIRAGFEVRKIKSAVLIRQHALDHGASGELGSVWSPGFSRFGV